LVELNRAWLGAYRDFVPNSNSLPTAEELVIVSEFFSMKAMPEKEPAV
jgi:hypothetical protein